MTATSNDKLFATTLPMPTNSVEPAPTAAEIAPITESLFKDDDEAMEAARRRVERGKTMRHVMR